MGLFIPRKDHHFVWCSDKLSMGSVAASWDDHPKCPVFNKHQFKSISPGCGLSSLYIYIIIHIYSVSRIKQKSENSFRTPLNIFPFFFLQIYKKSTFCHLPLGVQCTARVPRWWRAPSLCPNIACNGSGHAPMKTCWRSIPRWGSV